jgi:hypothetical protein
VCDYSPRQLREQEKEEEEKFERGTESVTG